MREEIERERESQTQSNHLRWREKIEGSWVRNSGSRRHVMRKMERGSVKPLCGREESRLLSGSERKSHERGKEFEEGRN